MVTSISIVPGLLSSFGLNKCLVLAPVFSISIVSSRLQPKVVLFFLLCYEFSFILNCGDCVLSLVPPVVRLSPTREVCMILNASRALLLRFSVLC